jgi:hypothetical protein
MNLHERFEALDVVAIDAFLADQQEENIHLDFKTADPVFVRDDRRNLAEAVSGFANSEGGLIVWGVEARQNPQGVDCACGKREISPLSLFLSKLNQYTGDAATPIVDGVQHKKIVATNDRGFAVTFVPPSEGGPHMAKLGVDRYMKRSGSQFLKMEHFEVNDMFGRRKRPVLRLGWCSTITTRIGNGDVHFRVVLGIENSGRGSATAPFLSLRIEPPYRLSQYGLDGNQRHGLPRLVSGRNTAEVQFGGMADVVIHPGILHEVTGIDGYLRSAQENIDDLVIEYSVAAEDIRMHSDVLRVSGADLVAAIRRPSA